ncbi:ABC transporter [Histoplasma capsulatum]|uniref:ABC transporter n=1 Tax=Ajellomyces capsulatus TaxID=5037 RepID=A0A8A1LYX1_AJECA|nr:ABC transporter [Histoplasma capsulatum]
MARPCFPPSTSRLQYYSKSLIDCYSWQRAGGQSILEILEKIARPCSSTFQIMVLNPVAPMKTQRNTC